MFVSHVTPTQRSRRIANASSEELSARLHSPTAGGDDAVRQQRQRDAPAVSERSIARRFGSLHEPGVARLSVGPVRIPGGRFSARPARNARRLARIKRHVQMARDEIRGADHVYQREARCRRPAGVEAKQRSAPIVVAGRARSPARASETCAPPHQRPSSPCGAAGKLSPTLSSTLPDETEAAVDMSADQELLRRATA